MGGNGEGRSPDNLSPGSGICVFLGAGASACAGYRTFFSFPRLFFSTQRRASALQAPDNEYGLLLGVREQLRRTKKRETLDNYLWALEHYYAWTCTALSRADVREQFRHDLALWPRAVDLRDTVCSLRRNIARLSIEHYSSPPQGNTNQWAQRAAQFYYELGKSASRITAFTTNYDLLPEYLFSRQRTFSEWRDTLEINTLPAVQLTNGIEGFEEAELPQVLSGADEGRGPIWSGSYPKDRGAQGDAVCVLELYRLHGCVGWYYDPLPVDAHVRFVLPVDLDNLCRRAPDFDRRLCVMYPGKEQHVGRPPHGPGFLRLCQTSRSTGHVLFIGFAFEDDDVVRAVFSSLAYSDTQPRLSVIDPHLTQSDVVAKIGEAQSRSSVPLWVPSEEEVELHSIPFPPEDPSGLAEILSTATQRES